MELLLDGSQGSYVPLVFARDFDLAEWHIPQFVEKVLLFGPDHPEYWDAWDYVLSQAYRIDWETKHRWKLYQKDDSLWAICEDEEVPEG